MTFILLIVSAGLAGFAINRLYVMAKYKAINVKGQHYDKTGSLSVLVLRGSCLFHAAVGLGIMVLSSADLLGLL